MHRISDHPQIISHPDLAYKLWNNAHTATLEYYGLKEGFSVLFRPSIEN